MLFEIVMFLFFLTLYHYVWHKRRPARFPPGPIRWPLVGNLIQVGLEPHKTMLNMKKKYGDIIGVDLGPKRVVFINKYELVKEAFNLQALSARPFMPYFAVQETWKSRGLANTSGRHWQEQRRFFFSYVRSGIRNGVATENLILLEANELIDDLNEKCGLPMSTKQTFCLPTVNTLWSMLTGERYAVTDPKFTDLSEYTEKFAEFAAIEGLFVYFPKLATMFPGISGYQGLMAVINPVLDFIGEIINRHKETYQEGIQRDFIDSFLQKISITTDKYCSFFGKTGDESLLHVLYHSYIAGSETVATTLRWLIFLMAHHPEIQEKLWNNISKTVQPGQMPKLENKKQLPFVEALIMEVLRFSSIGAVGLPHEAAEDVEFHGYLIPKGCIVMANLFGIAHDPDVWGDPEKFRPERFLNENETEVLENQPFIPFSIGRRVCPGESFARDELFIFTMRLFQSFKVEFDPNEPTPLIRHINGATLSPEPHKVIFSKRQCK